MTDLPRQVLGAHARFRELVRAGAPGAALVDACERLRDWLAFTPAERDRALRQALATAASARVLLQAKALVSMRIWRETVPPDTSADAFFSGLESRLAQGTASSVEQRYVRDLLALQAVADTIASLFPDLDAPSAKPDMRQETLVTQLVPALQDAMAACDRTRATLQSLAALQHAIADFDDAARDWAPPLPTDHAWWLGMARYTLGRTALELGDPVAARAAFATGAEDFARAGDAANQADMLARVAAIDTGTHADFDAVAGKAMATLRLATDPLSRAAALDEIATAASNAGDRYELARIAGQLAETLTSAGYPDPEPDVAAAVGGWIETAAHTTTGDALLARLCEVGTRWARVMSGREAERRAIGTTRAQQTAASAEACLHAIAAELSTLGEQAEVAHREVEQACSVWFDQMPRHDAAVNEGLRGQRDRFAREQALGTSLLALRDRCNVHAEPALLTEADRLIAAADAEGGRLLRVRARLERAYVLLALGRHDEVHPLVAEAQALLMPGQPPALDALSSANEQDTFITGVTLVARASAAAGDAQAVITHCTPVLAVLDAQRERVNTPYQRAAFLGRRAELYELVIASAHRLGDHDLLLHTVERLKANGAQRALRAAHDRSAAAASEPPPGVAAEAWSEACAECDRVDTEYRLANAGLARMPASGTARDQLEQHRRLLAGSRAIAHAHKRALGGRAVADAGVRTVRALQAALAADEAAVSWCWVGDERLLVLASTRDRFVPVSIPLDADARTWLVQWQQCISSLGGWARATELLTPEIDRLVDALGPVLLPRAVRDVIGDCPRVVLSPHRALHLFPFHAIAWPGSDDRLPYLGTQRIVRYAPNLTSMVAPWDGTREGPTLAVGVSRFTDTSLPPLAGAAAEARAVAAVYGALGTLRLDCTRAQFVDEPLPRYRVVHLASHGSSLLQGDCRDDPLGAGVALHDGTIDGWQLASLDLPAEFVVLAACHSGQRAVGGRGMGALPGDDLLGLQGALFEAGVGSTLGTLWPIDDEGAILLLTAVHEAFARGADPDEALHHALNQQLRAHGAAHGHVPPRWAWAAFFVSALGNPRRHTAPATVVPTAGAPIPSSPA